MNQTLLIFGILIGSFITLFFVIYYNYTYNYENFYDKNLTDNNDSTNNPISLENITNDDNNDSTNNPISLENITNDDNNQESSQKEESQKENLSLSLNDSNDAAVSINECYSLFELNNDSNNSTYDNYPEKNHILMQISTENEGNINNSISKWYDNFNYDINSSNHDNNKFWFITSNNINQLTTNKYANGALLKDIQLTGPSSMQFANNNITLGLSQFTVVLTTIINSMDIDERYCLFKMALQKIVDYTTTVDNTLSYGGHIALILKKRDCNNIALHIYFADKEFYWTNIPINILHKNIIISLSYLHNEGISILIDNLQKNFSFDVLHEYKFGSTPIIINENGKLDMTLYNFTYYNIKLSNTDINSFININNHLLNNKHRINDNYLSQIKELQIDLDNNKSLVRTLTNDKTNLTNELADSKK
jgi:hypothetical protein